MESYDTDRAQRVWQRVQSERPVPEADFSPMMLRARQTAGAYLALARRISRDTATLKALANAKQAQAACLTGMQLLSGLPVPDVILESGRGDLGWCYAQELQALGDYELWSSHRRFGPAFRDLAAEQLRHCRQVLELAGRIGKMQKSGTP